MRIVHVVAAVTAVVMLVAGCSNPGPESSAGVAHPAYPEDLPPVGTTAPEAPASTPPAPDSADPSAPEAPEIGPGDGWSAVSLAYTALGRLDVRPETDYGYSPAKFPHWSEVDGGPCTVDEFLLRSASVLPPKMVLGSCRVSSGEWVSPYDGRRWSDPDDVAIDHVVPLAEAWASGADQWDQETREAFANDLTQGAPELLVVTDEVHQAKGMRDPAEWMPRANGCGYAVVWVLVKDRWGLAVDAAERDALMRALGECA